MRELRDNIVALSNLRNLSGLMSRYGLDVKDIAEIAGCTAEEAEQYAYHNKIPPTGVYNALASYFNWGKHHKQRNSSRYFSNTSCEYYPCHAGADAANFNCLFCYCPLYALPDCGGSPTYLSNGVKDCSGCLRPHENYEAVIERLRKEVRQWTS